MSFPAPQYSNRASLIQLALIMSLILAFGLAGNGVNPWLQYQRDAILQGQLWRLFTGHLVHLGAVHCLLNLMALFLILHIFRGVFTSRAWWNAGLSLSLSISVLFLIFNPKLHYYAGLSGVLHGLLVMALIASCQRKDLFSPVLVTLILAAVLAKLIYEQTPEYNAGYLQTYMNAPVIVDAHAYGAVAGGCFGLVQWVWKRFIRQWVPGSTIA